MSRAVFPGTFDPPTVGHLDIVTRAAAAFDELIVATGLNQSKNRLFEPQEERADALLLGSADHHRTVLIDHVGLPR